MPRSWLSGLRLRRARAPALPGVTGPQQFRRVLDREVAQAARTRHAIAILAFAVPSFGPALPEVVKLITTRVRSTDAIGWLGPKQLGVLLRYVEAEDALQVAAELCSQLERDTHPTRCTVYPYPPVSPAASPERQPEQLEGRRAYAFSPATLHPSPSEPALE